MKILITGGLGFIGSNLADFYVKNNHQVNILDDFSTGKKEFLSKLNIIDKVKVFKGSLNNLDHIEKSMEGCDLVCHLAANADVRFGVEKPTKDLQINTIGTSNILITMKKMGIKKIIFSSTGSVYGEASQIPTKENSSFPIQTSFYGASKVAGEGLISSYCEAYDFQSWIFRFVSILGQHYSHGHIYDFIKQLRENPNELKVLGDGSQRKSYLHVDDCIRAIDCGFKNSNDKINIFNLGTDEYCTVNKSINWITEKMKLNPKLIYSGGKQGWIGDNPFIYLCTQKIRNLGWKPKFTIKQSVQITTEYLLNNSWLYNK
jgi:UDP-glucose 4-epimerase